jgi:hypothetical protein
MKSFPPVTTSNFIIKSLLFTICYPCKNLPVVLNRCGTLSLTLREEYNLRLLENRVLRIIFGPKRDGVTGEWRKLHLYTSTSINKITN